MRTPPALATKERRCTPTKEKIFRDMSWAPFTKRRDTLGSSSPASNDPYNSYRDAGGGGDCPVVFVATLNAAVNGERWHKWGQQTRPATSVCQLRHDRMEQGPTEPHAGRGTFLLSSGGAGGAGITEWPWVWGRSLHSMVEQGTHADVRDPLN